MTAGWWEPKAGADSRKRHRKRSIDINPELLEPELGLCSWFVLVLSLKYCSVNVLEQKPDPVPLKVKQKNPG